MSEMSMEERKLGLERVRMCLAEVGYPNTIVAIGSDGIGRGAGEVPPGIRWDACYLVLTAAGHDTRACRECYVLDDMAECDHPRVFGACRD